MFKSFFYRAEVEETVWANIDIPTKTYTIHKDCNYVARKRETQLKGIERLKRDGGWLSFKSRQKAKKHRKNDYANFKIVEHC
jgi:hypothetical protein